MRRQSRTLVVLVGPTAVGKTEVAVELAVRFSADVISADARQIFRELTIGTAKPDAETLARARHHFIDSHSIGDKYDAAAFEREALILIDELFEKKDIIVLCGGSGLYVQAVCEGFDEIPEVPLQIRETLRKEYDQGGLPWLQGQMQHLDPGYFQVIDQQNPHRLLRALEVKVATGRSISDFQNRNASPRNFDIIKIGLERDRTELYERINRRMDAMIHAGLFDEAASLIAYRNLPALQTVGYQEIFGYLDGLYGWDEAVRLLKRNSRRYAKRQITWFRKDFATKWFHPEEKDVIYEYISSLLRS